MNKIVVVVALALVAAPVFADVFDQADVVSVSPRFKTISVPRTECWTETPDAPQPQAAGDRSLTGAVLGGVAGALLGNQVGRGNGRTAATAVGAVAGAITGDRIDNRAPVAQAPTRRCSTTQETQQQPDGYDVTYSYGGQTHVDRLSYNPGARVKVRLGIQ
uniref:glycine zipper 2TM domain-containing protein n=1 Tax=Sulfuriferula sp. GW6 TaxID=3345112 RepID=UPI0039F72E86